MGMIHIFERSGDDAKRFDEAMKRSGIYKDFEAHKREETCNLFKNEVM